jgi:hypothetical protein
MHTGYCKYRTRTKMKMCNNVLNVNTLKIPVFYDIMAYSLENCYHVLEKPGAYSFRVEETYDVS